MVGVKFVVAKNKSTVAIIDFNNDAALGRLTFITKKIS